MIEVFSTGGGIWLAEMDLGNKYAVVNSEAPDQMAIYNHAEDKYMPEDMIFSGNMETMDQEKIEVYNKLYIALKTK